MLHSTRGALALLCAAAQLQVVHPIAAAAPRVAVAALSPLPPLRRAALTTPAASRSGLLPLWTPRTHAAAHAHAATPCEWVATGGARMQAKAEESEEKMVGPVQLKYVVLVLLVLQNSLTAILARASRVPAQPGAQLYLGSVAVLVAEIMKLPVCLALIVRDEGGVGKMLKAVWEGVFIKWKDTLRMGVPALCYCLQNALFFVALSRLSATSYQLWSQSKTLFTALFFVSYLGQVLRKQQWLALVLLTVGVGLVQFYEAGGAAAAAAAAAGASPFSGAVAIGVGAVLASSLLSGFANVYFEKVIKTVPKEGEGKPVSIWMRNVQLGLFSLPQAASLMAADASIIQASGALVGFNALAWSVVTLKALGGLLVAAVVKYADNVLKTYATAIAIVLTCVVSCVWTASAPSLGFLQGMSMVIASIFLYNLGGKDKSTATAAPPPPVEEAKRADAGEDAEEGA